MKLFPKWFLIYAVLSLVFFCSWLSFGIITIGWDAVMPMWYKAPLLLSFYLPGLIYCVLSLTRSRVTPNERIFKKVKKASKNH